MSAGTNLVNFLNLSNLMNLLNSSKVVRAIIA